MGLGGETLTGGSAPDEATGSGGVLQGLARSRVVIEVGTHSAWVREGIADLGHGSKLGCQSATDGKMCGAGARMDRIDANRLARLGRWSRNRCMQFSIAVGKCEDLLVLRAREALVESRTKLISAVRGLVKTMGGVSSCSSDALRRKRSRRFLMTYERRYSRC